MYELSSRALRWSISLGLGVLGVCGCDDDVTAIPWDGGGGSEDTGNQGDGGEPDESEGAEWEIVFEELDSALFSVWGSAHDDVWVSGSDSGNGPLILRYDGREWTQLDSGESGDLWWVSGLGDDVWMAGTEGLVLRYARSEEQFETFRLADDVTLFGIFPVASDDVWAVGGSFTGDTKRVIYRFDGEEWQTIDDLPEQVAEVEAPFFKVWGRSSDDLWVVGDGPYALHRVDGEWQVLDVPDGRLFTVHGSGDYVAAVGGTGYGVLLEEDEGELVDQSPANALQLNGIWVRPNADAVAVGAQGVIFERENGGWVENTDVPLTAWDYHSVYVDPRGGRWAVGGQVVASPYSSGMLSHRGRSVSANGIE